MNQVICPLDNLPCEQDCPDRYKDMPEGGCFLTTAQELGAQVCYLGEGTVGLLFSPEDKKAPASAANAGEGGVDTSDQTVSTSMINENGDFVK